MRFLVVVAMQLLAVACNVIFSQQLGFSSNSVSCSDDSPMETTRVISSCSDHLVCHELVDASQVESSSDLSTNVGNDGILLVTFGSSFEAPQAVFKSIDITAKETFSSAEIRWAYTSDFIIRRLREGKGHGALKGKSIENDTPSQAITKMVEDGYSKISVQSLHVIPGDEFDDLKQTIAEARTAYPTLQITLGVPLLTSDADIKAVAKILYDKFEGDIEAGRSICLMGHGTTHKADVQYGKLDAELKKLYPHFYVGTVEGIAFEAEHNNSSIGGIIDRLDHKREVLISPLMSIVGDHANNDMVGQTGTLNVEGQSWLERLENEGFSVQTVMVGLGEYPELRALWMQHLQSVIVK